MSASCSLVYAVLTAISNPLLCMLVLIRILYRISCRSNLWIETINADVLFGIIICYANVILN